jgi:hypothetical protein
MLTGDAACPVGYGSLWDMLNFHAADFMHLMQILFDSELEVGRTSGPLPSGMIDTNMTAAEVIRERAEELHLPVTKGAAVYIEVSKTSRELSAAYLTVKRTMHQELMNRVFVEPEPKYKQYYEQTFLFGQNVFDAFPSANDDIYEAGMCLALERATGCVMHLNRALECGLSALARTLGVGQQTDWGAYLRKIQEVLDDRAKTAGKRSADEQFYAEAAANFDRLRRAWRNPTMHPEKTYSQERAEEILQAVKSFMGHLATRISETSP